MKKLLIALILLPLLIFGACAPDAATDDVSSQSDTGTVGEVAQPDTPPTEAELAALSESPAGAYFAVYQELLGYRTPETYVGLNPTGIEPAYLDGIITLLSQDLASKDLTLLLGSVDELADAGYIEKDKSGLVQGFPDGVVLSFRSGELTDTQLKIDAETWYGNLGMQGKSFTIIKDDGKWMKKPSEDGSIDAEWVA